MTYPLITDYNVSSGFHILFLYVNDITGGVFISLLLLMIWSVVTFGLYFTGKRTGAEVNFASAMATGSFLTVISCVLLSLIDGLVNPFTFAVCIMVSFASVVFLFMKKQD